MEELYKDLPPPVHDRGRGPGTFTVAFIVAADRPLSPVGLAFADLVTTHQP